MRIFKEKSKFKYIKRMHRKRPWPLFLGIPVDKIPTDLWIIQEIISEIKPDFIIELGTQRGGSTLYYASILDCFGRGRVITVDIKDQMLPLVRKHPRITQIIGDSVSEEVVNRIKEEVKGRVILDLDSNHHAEHVLRELELYSSLVSTGSYIIVEDTIIGHCGYRKRDFPEGGPSKAVSKFLKKHTEFKIDRTKHRFCLTKNPNGYLKKGR